FDLYSVSLQLKRKRSGEKGSNSKRLTSKVFADKRDEIFETTESLIGLFESTFAQPSRVQRRRSHTCGSVPRKLRVPVQLINDVSVQVEVGGACLCDSTTAPPLLDIATVAITDYYNSYVSSGTSIDR
ncbi:unnamed protein product, partial [Heterotrigona itama]